MLTDFGLFILIFNKMALIFLQVLIIFTVSSFQFQQVRLPWLHRPNSPSLNPLDYEVRGQWWSLNTSCSRSQKQF